MSDIVLVTGATGFIGRAVVQQLLLSGRHVRMLVRTGGRDMHANHPLLHRATGDVRDLKSLEAAMAGVRTVVHLAAAKNDETESDATNVQGAKNICEACRIAGVTRIINVSTQSAKLAHPGLYGWTKKQADEIFRQSRLPVVTLRSSLVYGNETSGVFGTIVRYSKLPVIPMIGSGEARFRPIHRDDLAAIIVRAVNAQNVIGKTYDIGGPDVVSLNAITHKILEARGIHRRIVHIPRFAGLMAARVLPFLFKHPPVTVSNVLGSTEDVPMDMEPFEEDFPDVQVRSFSRGMRDIFGPLPSKEEREALVLLRYVLSSVAMYEPSEADIDRYLQALKAHHATEVLEGKILRSRILLGGIDAATRMRYPASLLRRKLLIATAVAETQPTSALVLLPRERSMLGLLLTSIDLTASALFKIVLGTALLPFPSYIKRHAGDL